MRNIGDTRCWALADCGKIFTIALTVVVILANKQYGWERHIWDIRKSKIVTNAAADYARNTTWVLTAAAPDMIQSANIVAFIAKLLFTLAATFTRLSLICFYYRLVQDTANKWFKWALHASVAWTLAVCVTFIVLTIWLCSYIPPETAR